MQTTTNDLLPELQAFASLLDAQSPEVQEAFQFLLATAMHKAGRFELLNVAEVEGRWHYTFSGAGEVFSVVRPEMSKEMERQAREMVREIFVEQEQTSFQPCGKRDPGFRCTAA